MEAIWSRTLPSYQKIRELVADGSIGEVYNVSASFGFILDRVDRVMKKETGGGTILDLGIYTIQGILLTIYYILYLLLMDSWTIRLSVEKMRICKTLDSTKEHLREKKKIYFIVYCVKFRMDLRTVKYRVVLLSKQLSDLKRITLLFKLKKNI